MSAKSWYVIRRTNGNIVEEYPYEIGYSVMHPKANYIITTEPTERALRGWEWLSKV